LQGSETAEASRDVTSELVIVKLEFKQLIQMAHSREDLISQLVETEVEVS